jgi:hypothetical protein
MRCILILGILWGSGATPLGAGVIERDWKTSGDGLLTFDTVNQREWLDLSQTILSSQFPGADREARYQYVVTQTLPGGAFAGFNVAMSPDVIALAQSAGIDTSTLDYPINSFATTALGQMLGFTAQSSITPSRFAVGLLDELGNPPNSTRTGAKIGLSFTNQAGLRITSNDDLLFSPAPGVFLQRLAVPEPSTVVLASISALLALKSAWKR